jgi:arylsulfatase A-like enzyme
LIVFIDRPAVLGIHGEFDYAVWIHENRKAFETMIDRRDLLTGCGIAMATAMHVESASLAPNIITILLDDSGYGDYSCYGHPTILTPHIDRMAQEGMRFTQVLASPLSTASRGQLLTGRLGIRTGLTTNLFPWSEGGIPDSEITVAQMLKKANYNTMCVGKWHLGHLPRYLPSRHGFDDYFGIPYANDMSKATNPGAEWAGRTPPTPLMRGEAMIEQEPDQSLLTHRYTDRAIQFIRKSNRAGSPFFLYISHTMPHQPIAASSSFRGKSLCGLYGDVMQELDWSVGEILRVLREEKVDRNTLVIFTSGNGPSDLSPGSSGPFRGRKGTTWEGGVRVPFIAWWPGKLSPGVVTPAFGTTMDLFPSFLKLAGLKMPGDRVYDGADLTPVLFGNDPGREPFYFYYCNSRGVPDRQEILKAVRKGRWKLHVAVSDAGTETRDGEPPLLFDVQEDISEQRNQAKKQSEIVNELSELIHRHQASFTPGTTQR